MGMDLDGTISYKISEISSVTVPAGTYEALNIEIKPSTVDATYSMGEVSFHMHLACMHHLIEFRIDQSAMITAEGQTQSMEMTIQMQLIEHLK